MNKLYIEPTSLCNLNCTMCFRNNWFNEKCETMNSQTINNVLEILKADICKNIFFGGMGEPLICKDIYNMIFAAKNSGKKTELITNATLLDMNASTMLIENGLDTLWVSMDGFSKESYENIRTGSIFEKITKNLEGFSKIKGQTKLGITFVMTKENISELDNINDFCDKYNVDFINLSHVVPSIAMPAENSIYDLSYRIGKMRRFDKNEVFQKERDVCPFVKEDMCFIRFDGEVMPCMQLLHNSYTYLYDEKRKLNSYSFGNINKNSLTEIWFGEKYSNFRKNVLEFDFPCCTVCLGCSYRLENLTDCMYNEEPTCGACLWAQGLIRCP